MLNKLWDISQSGADSIRDLEQNLINTLDEIEKNHGQLNSSFHMLSNDLGIYAEPVEEALNLMNKVNEECKASMESLIKRLEKYASKIEDELSKSDL